MKATEIDPGVFPLAIVTVMLALVLWAHEIGRRKAADGGPVAPTNTTASIPAATAPTAEKPSCPPTNCVFATLATNTIEVTYEVARNLCIGPVTIETRTGRVTIEKGVSLDLASHEFWRRLQKVYPEMFPCKAGDLPQSTQRTPR
jgi:hypothetical protein